MVARAGKCNFGAKVGKYKFGVRVGKYKLGTRACKYKLGARAGGWGRGLGIQTPKIKRKKKFNFVIFPVAQVFRQFSAQSVVDVAR